MLPPGNRTLPHLSSKTHTNLHKLSRPDLPRLSRRATILRQIAHLFALEQSLKQKKASYKLREVARNSSARPIVERIYRALECFQASNEHLPQSPSGKAIAYCLNQRDYLNKYLEDGRLEISTNLVENAIRPTAIGKKNWLFIGGAETGWASAVLYTVITSCRNHGADPYEYIKHALTRLPEMTNHQVAGITPRAYAAERRAREKSAIRLAA